ncbi:DUF2536 family protein [Paenibacillus sp. F6_3S_P_1C]|uniref:DUF2536 family protein n=1 Tax=Paenibacillus vandeheii TaxID=3035917 RepID=A0ABT8JIT3_9BACL|nr:DUF2536 family protein [Paenibacillus vandeheii]MDN4604962.1 DUF2536 family protein [Paenibacillus vandeheii]
MCRCIDLHELELAIEERIGMNKALLLRVNQVQQKVMFDPIRNKMLYSTIVHFAID